MFKQYKAMNAFLLKKNQQKQKSQEQQKSKQFALKLQKNLRCFLTRKKITNTLVDTRDIRMALLIKTPLSGYSQEEVVAFIERATHSAKDSKHFYLSRFVLGSIDNESFFPLCMEVLSKEHNSQVRELVFKNAQYLSVLKVLLERGLGSRLLDLSVQHLLKRGHFSALQSNLLLKTVLRQFADDFFDIQSPYGSTISDNTIRTLMRVIVSRRNEVQAVPLSHLARFLMHYLRVSSGEEVVQQDTVCFLLSQLMRLGAARHEQITKGLIKDNQALIALVQDEDLLQELQAKMRQGEILEIFTNDFLNLMQRVMTSVEVLTLFSNPRCSRVSHTLLAIIGQLGVLFQDRRLIFVRELISSDAMLRKLVGSQDPMFFEGLKMRLLAMDDEEFAQWTAFSLGEWQRVIDNCVATADTKIQKLIEKSNGQLGGRLVPFKKRNSDELEMKTVVDLLSNLHKKSLRTGKINPYNFVNYQLSAAFQGFLFGKGARRIQMLLRQLPFVFSFQSRMRKLKQFVKQDKKNYDRSLFLQEEVEEDLIMAVRRGNEFQDAYQACMTRDLRKKYKIVFFNQQGLEEEGVDGGGIIKEFINRVLRASFSENYGLFMETARNEILPNPHSQFTSQYEFVGRLVGKAVYQGINIQQKFAEPFLNLVIGRQNTFEDLQFVDPDVYRGLLSIKNSTQDISAIEQTFVIFDRLPNGNSRYIDLLCPAKSPPPEHRQVLVTNENKMQFVMSYADFKCNKQIQQKTRLFRRGFLKVMKPEWLTMFSNQQLNAVISGDNPDFDVDELRANTVYNDYHEKEETIIAFWQVLREMNRQEKSLFLLYVTSCSRPPTLGFAALKPKMCLSKDNNTAHLPTANTCMNVLRLPNYKNKESLKKKLLYAISARAGFEFA